MGVYPDAMLEVSNRSCYGVVCDEYSFILFSPCSLASYLAREPLMPFSSCDKYKRNTKQRRRSCTMLLWIWKRNLIVSQGK